MKKAILFLMVLMFLLPGTGLAVDAVSSATVKITEVPEQKTNENARVLVLWFSTNDTVKAVALTAADALGADSFEIVPEQPYTEADLAYYTDGRCDREQKDASARPGIARLPGSLEKYDVLLLGYPIWHGQAPKILYTLLESIDVSGKTIIPFCTSASSGAGSSASNLQNLTDSSATWQDAVRISNNSTAEDVRSWAVSALAEVMPEDDEDIPEESVLRMKVSDGTNTVIFRLNNSPSALSLYGMLPMDAEVKNYGSNEKIFYPPQKIETKDGIEGGGEAGKLALFSPWGNVVMYYGSFESYPGLYILGEAEEGKDLIEKLSGTLHLEAVQSVYLGETGWVQNEDGSWSCGDEDGNALLGMQTIGGTKYMFDEKGVMVTGWLEVDGKWYFAEDSGVLANGWKSVGGTWYYFKSSGEMATGWLESGGDWYYMKNSGEMATGWLESGGDWYFMRDSGVMATGWVKSGNDWYFMRPTGIMATGWVKSGNDWYYMRPTGVMATGWVQDGAWYYFNGSGKMATGWVKDGGSWYYFKSSGAMKTGWLELGNEWYWFDGSGVMATGWKEISGQWEMFDDSGVWLYTWQGE